MSRRWISLGLMLAIGLAFAGCASTPGEGARPGVDRPVIERGKLHRFTLGNGLEVQLLEDHRLPRIAMGFLLRRGSAIEPLEKAGVGVLMAEVMKRGAGERDALALANMVDSLGASLSVSSGWDSMSVGISGLSRDMPVLLEILRDVARAPRFDAAEVEAARAEQRARIASDKDDPRMLIYKHFASGLYPEHRYGIPREGTLETVARLDVVTLRDFYARVFVASDAIFFASGDFDPAMLRSNLETLFGDWEQGEVPAAVSPPPAHVPPARTIFVVDRPELVQARIMVGHEGLARDDERRVAANLMNGILGGDGFSSRLMKRIRSDEGLTYGIYSGIAYRRRPGPFQVGTFTRVPEVGRVVDLILEELERMKTQPPSKDEIEQSKSYAIGQFALGLETTDAVLAAQIELALYGLPDDSLDTYRSRLRAVSEQDIAEEARALLHPERVVIVAVGPADAIVPQLETLGEVHVVSP